MPRGSYGGDGSRADLNNHANQCNPNNDAYWRSRGSDSRPSNWQQSSAGGGGGGGGGDCFPADACAIRPDGSAVKMTDLKIGDSILAMCATGVVTTEVYSFGHFDPDAIAKFISVTTEFGDTIRASPTHLMPVVGKGFVPISSTAVGDKMYTLDADGKAMSEATVVQIEMSKESGLFAPMTLSGTIIVDNFGASCYSVLRHHGLFHIAMLPVRMMYKVDRRLTTFAHDHGGFRIKGAHIYIDLMSVFRPVVSALKI